MCRSMVSVRIGVSVECCHFARGMRGPPVFLPEGSPSRGQVGSWRMDARLSDRSRQKKKLRIASIKTSFNLKKITSSTVFEVERRGRRASSRLGGSHL